MRPLDRPLFGRHELWVRTAPAFEHDLSRYAGREVKVIFNTEPGDVGNAVGDACVWGTPRIVRNAAAGS